MFKQKSFKESIKSDGDIKDTYIKNNLLKKYGVIVINYKKLPSVNLIGLGFNVIVIENTHDSI